MVALFLLCALASQAVNAHPAWPGSSRGPLGGTFWLGPPTTRIFQSHGIWMFEEPQIDPVLIRDVGELGMLVFQKPDSLTWGANNVTIGLLDEPAAEWQDVTFEDFQAVGPSHKYSSAVASPEPTTAGLSLLGVTVLTLRRRRQRS